MSEYRIHQDINLFEIADEYAKRLGEQVDELALGMAAETLAKYGYVKVVRCMDCNWFTNSSHYGAYCTNFGAPLHDDYDGYCAWGVKRKEGE